MKMKSILIVLMLNCIFSSTYAQDEIETISDVADHVMISGFGFGYSSGYAFDKNMYNNVDKVKYNPIGWFSFYLTNESFSSLSFDIFATVSFQETVCESQYPRNDESQFYLLEYGVKIRKYFMDQEVDPYGYIKISGLYGANNTERSSTDFAILRGGLIGVGIGFSFDVLDHVVINAEGGLDLGVAFWDDYPIRNSDGVYFNPSAVKFGINALYIF